MEEMITPNITGNRIKKYLAEGKRFDGRTPFQFRDIVIEPKLSKNAEGSVMVKLGNTEVAVGVKMGTSTPYSDSPDKGTMMVTSELLPLSSPRFDYGPPKFPAIELARVVDRAIRESKFIQFDKLCIEEGEKVWTVFIDIYTINDDGNLQDAASIGALAALRLAKMPKYDKENDKVLYGEWTEESLPVKDELPISMTFHKIGGSFLVDPTREEEDISDSRLTVGSAGGMISSMQKGNSQTLEMEDLNIILENVDSVRKTIEDSITKLK
ncbi:MAG: exosome complex protein Rrp42 [Candidatus Pacearchaeota archaeon]|nr:exosome complex protein Rrp42 [Candidatus Pacearchaeota archaeon]